MEQEKSDEAFELRRDLAGALGKIDADYLRIVARIEAIEMELTILQGCVTPPKDLKISRR